MIAQTYAYHTALQTILTEHTQCTRVKTFTLQRKPWLQFYPQLLNKNRSGYLFLCSNKYSCLQCFDTAVGLTSGRASGL